jgi:CRP/FNR family transcriptional regulator, cyclic AMP receptor protein
MTVSFPSMPARTFLARLQENERTALEAAGRRRPFSAGQVLFSEGDDGRDVFIVLDGVVKLVTPAASGQQVILDLESAGSLLGELSAIDGQPRSATAEAVTPIDVLVVRFEAFRNFLESQPRAATELLGVVAARLRESSQRQLEFGSSDALTRLCRSLLVMIDRFGNQDSDPSVHLPIAQHDLAKLTGLSREAVVKGLRRLRDLAWVETSGRTFVIRDLQAVRDRAQT